jgi:hypothetical protein
MRTITLTTPMSFTEALARMIAGECLGIRPGKNTNYVVAFKPPWMNTNGSDFMLCWQDSDARSPNSQIRSNQFMEEWYLVIADHRSL